MTEIFKEETLTEKFLKKGFWLYFFTFLIAPSGYFVRVIFSNSLSVSDFGLLYSILSFVLILSSYNDLGFTGALNYFLPKYWINKKYDFFKTAIFLSLGVQVFTGFFISLFLFFGADFLASNYFDSPNSGPVLKIFCFYFLGINLFQILSTLFTSFQDTFSQKFIDFIKMWTVCGFSIFFFLTNGNIFNYALSWLFGLFFGLAIGVFIFLKKYTFVLEKGKFIWDKKMINEYKNYAFYSFLGMNSGLVLGQIDQQMIVYFLGTEKAGFYSNYLSLTLIFATLVGPILGFLFPVISEMINKKHTEKLILIQSFFYKYIGIFSLSFGAFLFTFGPIISLVFFGKKFIFSGELLLFSSLFLFFNTLLVINFSFLGAYGLVKENVKIVGITAFFNLILNFIFIDIFGIIGPIITTNLGWIFMFFATLNLLKKQQKIIFDWKFFFKNTFFIGILSFILYFIKDSFFILENNFRFKNLLFLFIFGIIYYLILLILNLKEVIFLKNNIGNILKK